MSGENVARLYVGVAVLLIGYGGYIGVRKALADPSLLLIPAALIGIFVAALVVGELTLRGLFWVFGE